MMRIYLLVLLLVLFSCHKDEFKRHNYNLVGKWKLIESYVNPGNGGYWQKSKTYTPLTIEFTSDGKMISNFDLYSGYSGYKLVANNTIEFLPPLNGVTRAVYYSFTSDTELTVTYACIEGCGDRFVKY
jgi:hypothetical protein